MLENIAMWGGVAGVAVAVLAIIILFLTRQSIIHILDKDKILFDQNFEIKQKAINNALATADEIVEKGVAIKNNVEFIKKAKLAYNDLICVLSDVRIADEFYTIAIENDTPYNEARIAQFKLMCRKDIGLKVAKSQIVKRVLNKQKQNSSQPYPTQPQVPQQPQYIPQQEQYPQYQSQPQQEQPQPRLVQQMRQTQPNPTQPVRPATRPTQPIKRSDRPNDDSSLF